MSLRRPGHTRRQLSVEYPKYLPVNSTTQQQPSYSDMLAQTILASDYDSDNQGYASDYPAQLPPQHRTKEELNLSVLHRWRPEIIEILSVAPYATIYDFAATTNEWQKSGLVGTLFICRLTPGEYGEDRYRAVVLNRSGLDNFEADLRQSDRGGVAMQGEFVEMTRDDQETGETKVNAIYIYSEDNTSTAGSREINGHLMVQLANAAKLSREAAEAHAHQPRVPEPESEPEPEFHTVYPPSQPSPAPPIAPQPSRQIDLLALLRGGQSDAESVHSRPPEPSTGSDLLSLFRNSGARI